MLFPENVSDFPTSSLSSVDVHEDWVVSLLKSGDGILAQHFPNIITYLDTYAPYHDLLSGKEAEDVSLFIHNSKNVEIEDIARRIDKIRKNRLNIQERINKWGFFHTPFQFTFVILSCVGFQLIRNLLVAVIG